MRGPGSWPRPPPGQRRYGAGDEGRHHRRRDSLVEPLMVKPDDLSKPPVAFDHDSTLVVVLEMSGRSWLAAAIVPGVDRRPLQKLPVDKHRLYQLVERWRGEGRQHGKAISRVVLALEAGRGGCWLARRLPDRR